MNGFRHCLFTAWINFLLLKSEFLKRANLVQVFRKDIEQICKTCAWFKTVVGYIFLLSQSFKKNTTNACFFRTAAFIYISWIHVFHCFALLSIVESFVVLALCIWLKRIIYLEKILVVLSNAKLTNSNFRSY